MSHRIVLAAAAGILSLGAMLGAGQIGTNPPPPQPDFARGPFSYTGSFDVLVYIQDPGPEPWHYYQISKPGRPALRIDPTPVMSTVSQLQPGQRIRAYGRYRTASTPTGTIRYMYVTSVDILR